MLKASSFILLLALIAIFGNELINFFYLGQGGGVVTSHQGVMKHENPLSLDEIERYLLSMGYTIHDLCHPDLAMENLTSEHKSQPMEKIEDLPFRDRFLLPQEETDNDIELESKDTAFYIKNGFAAFACVTVAALAAGLTLGLVSQEYLDLKIKSIAGTATEKEQATVLLPLLEDHHRLLVTLLLINAMANEALPLFLDKLVSPLVAIILSVTLVLFFGEVIPSAIFSGPNKLSISSKLAPLVKFLLFIMYPLAKPIGKALDTVLHEDGEEGDYMMQKYTKKELSALIRLQFEERRASIKGKTQLSETLLIDNSDENISSSLTKKHDSTKFIKHEDTVSMVDGALKLQEKTVFDAMVKMKDTFCLGNDVILDEENILEIYRRGFSRIPIYAEKNRSRIIGIFRARQLMVINAGELRTISALPLSIPHCVSPNLDMINLINLFQTGMTGNKGGHMAIVCVDPTKAAIALRSNQPIPDIAGIIGIVTLENCLESLIQEHIYDEYDQKEKLEMKRAKWALKRWKKFVGNNKTKRDHVDFDKDSSTNFSLSEVADAAVETTHLLSRV